GHARRSRRAFSTRRASHLEDLLWEDAGGGGHVDEHGGGQVVALRQVGRAGPAGGQGGLVLAGLHVAHHPLVVLGVDQGADLGGGVGGGPDLDVLGPLHVPGDEVVVDGAVDQDAGGGGAPLPVEGEDPEEGGVQRGLQVGVGEDDRRGLAPQLQ